MEIIRKILEDESGASSAEYGLLVAILVVVIVIALSALGTIV
ncbi:MAG: Flp family type IVb pilin [Deltaproteobacteria bacterium]|nr:Flp family type IVb pilin [Deltaproteobacteria bacterium]